MEWVIGRVSRGLDWSRDPHEWWSGDSFSLAGGGMEMVLGFVPVVGHGAGMGAMGAPLTPVPPN